MTSSEGRLAVRAGRRELWLGVVPVAAAALVYASIVDYSPVADHYLHLYNAINDGFARFLVRPHARHVLVTWRAVFYAFHQLFGLHAELWFLAVLLTHLANVFLLFLVIRLFTGRPRLAAAGAALWGVSPVHLEAVGWLSTYGPVLVATCLLWILFDIGRIQRGDLRLTTGTLIRWALLLLAASTSFGIGLGPAMVSAGFVPLLLPRVEKRARVALVFASMLLVVPLVFASLHGLHARLSAPPELAGAGATSGIPMLELVLSSLSPARWSAILSIFLGLFAYGVSSLLLGPFIASLPTGATPGVFPIPLEGMMTLRHALQVSHGLGALFLLGWLGALLAAPPVRRRQLLALALIAASAYGVIAIGVAPNLGLLRMSLEWLVLQPRYQYVGALAICIGLCLMLDLAAPRRRFVRRVGGAIFAGWIAFTLPFSMQSSAAFGRSEPRDRGDELARTAARIQELVDRRPEGTAVYIVNRPFAPTHVWRIRGFPGWAGVFVVAFPENVVDGRRVFFVESDPKALEQARSRPGTRIAELLLSPAEARARRSSK